MRGFRKIGTYSVHPLLCFLNKWATIWPMESWQILLIIVAVILFIYLAAFFVIVSHAFDFNLRLKRRLRALNIILFEKRELLLKLNDAALSEGATFSERDKENLSTLQQMSFNKPVFAISKNAISLQKAIQSRLFYIVRSNSKLKEDPQIQSILDMIGDLDRNIRTSCSLYNADVQAYNYWIAVPFFKWLFFILGQRTRNPII